MIELRWLTESSEEYDALANDYCTRINDKKLQYRTKESVMFEDNGECWTEWIDVPSVHIDINQIECKS